MRFLVYTAKNSSRKIGQQRGSDIVFAEIATLDTLNEVVDRASEAAVVINIDADPLTLAQMLQEGVPAYFGRKMKASRAA